VVHLEDLNGTINTSHPFNRMQVDAGFAVVKNFTHNEFDPAAWWGNATTEPEPDEVNETATTTTEGQFVGSTKSDKYHYPSCRWAEKILPENEIWFASAEEARAAGYVPCGVCNPP